MDLTKEQIAIIFDAREFRTDAQLTTWVNHWISTLLAAILVGIIFLSSYLWRIAADSRRMTDALVARRLIKIENSLKICTNSLSD